MEILYTRPAICNKEALQGGEPVNPNLPIE